MKERKIVDPREIWEILNYYTAYGEEAPELVKKQDVVKLAQECLALREALKNVLSVDISRIQTDNRSVVAIDEMRNAAEEGLGKINTSYI